MVHNELELVSIYFFEYNLYVELVVNYQIEFLKNLVLLTAPFRSMLMNTPCRMLLCIWLQDIISIIVFSGEYEYFMDPFVNTETNIGKISVAFYQGLFAYNGW